MPARPIGTFTQKIHCQAMPWVMAPPSTGPTAAASPVTPPKIPIAQPRRCGGKAAFSSAPAPRSPRERQLVSRFVDAFEAADAGKLVDLLTDDAWLTMPPEPLE